jgi:hypothetical protein
MFKILGAALVAAVTFGAAASAATLSGTFSVTAVNVTNVNSLQSAATTANFDAALAGTFGAFATDTFTYVGEIDFGTFDHTDATTISDWLDTGTPGGVSGLDAAFGDLQLSKDNIFASPATASTTFFLFTLQKIMSSAANFTVTHDDGVAFFDDGVGIGGFSAPTVVNRRLRFAQARARCSRCWPGPGDGARARAPRVSIWAEMNEGAPQMTTALYMHDDCLGHVTPPGHPERVARIEAVARALAAPGFAALDRRAAPMAAREDCCCAIRAATSTAVAAAIPAEGWVSLDADTHVSPGSLRRRCARRGLRSRRWTRCWRARSPTPSWPAARPATTPSARRRWASASSAPPPSRRATRWSGTGFPASRSWISTCTTATARRTSSGTRRARSSSRPTRCRSIRAPAIRHETGAHDNVMNIPLAPGPGAPRCAAPTRTR